MTTKKERVPFVKQFKGFSGFLQDQGIEHWLDFGTLLGAVRTGEMIESDVDVDFDVWACDVPRILETEHQVDQLFGLKIRHEPSSNIIRVLPGHKGLDLRSDWVAHQSCISWGVPYLDLYPCTPVGQTLLHCLPEYNFKTHFTHRLKRLTFHGFEFPAPANDLLLLEHRYGPDWATPLELREFQRRANSLIIPFPEKTVCVAFGSPEHSACDNASIRRLENFFDSVIPCSCEHGVIEFCPHFHLAGNSELDSSLAGLFKTSLIPQAQMMEKMYMWSLLPSLPNTLAERLTLGLPKHRCFVL